uniref:Homoserine kinase n=1 Tax=Magnetococcus massalia (strain MO-1) TaxID=451514 RepID=A0A1S7LIF8_MAGMO|nr:Homoserine kinase [Candidatus Magnetococcus massalia]
MSVYTQLSLNDLAPLLAIHDLGEAISLEGIAEGVVNTNYRLFTSRGRFILTLVERSRDDYLNWMLGLLSYCQSLGLPCPQPIVDHKGNPVHQIKQRPALLVTHLDGQSPQQPTPTQTAQTGRLLARLHHIATGFEHPRPNPLGPATWQQQLEQLTPLLIPEQADLLAKTLPRVEQELFNRADLPTGIGHGDLFPDNTLFDGEVLTGVIDFHYACTLPWIYDLAITLCAWGFDTQGDYQHKNFKALWRGYTEARSMQADERAMLPIAMQAAALRFSLSRLRDWHFPREGEQVMRKDPEPFLRMLNWLSSEEGIKELKDL